MDELRQAKGETPELGSLEEVLLNKNNNVPLANRFRALFYLKSLGTEGDEKAIDIIAKGFQDDSELLKHEIAYVLGQTKQEYAIKYLMEALDDQNQQCMVRHEAAEALGAIGSQSVIDKLEHYYEKDPNEIIRQTCELALERIKWENSAVNDRDQLQTSLYTSIDPAPPLPSDNDKVDQLRNMLNDQTETLFNRYRAMFRLRDLATPEAIQALASGFDDPSALFRHEIAYVFGQLCDPDSVPALTKVLNDKSEEAMVRHEAAEALGSIATGNVLSVLNETAKDEELVVRQSAQVALDMYEFENSDQIDYTDFTSVTAS